MKVSIITAVLNGAKTIEYCIQSVLMQTYPHIEHIIIDGGSTDGTVEIIKKYEDKIAYWVSEPDNGYYDAINKGIKAACGDIIGILNSDDFYANDKVIEKVVDVFRKNNVDSCYGDLQYVDKRDPDKVIRYWKSSPYRNGLFKKGWMIPHPTFFVKRKVYEKYGLFNSDLKIAADYELMLRFLEKNKISTYYIPEVLVKMRLGGASNRSVLNLIRKSYEDYLVLRMHNIGGLLTLFRKNLSKISQFFKKTVKERGHMVLVLGLTLFNFV